MIGTPFALFTSKKFHKHCVATMKQMLILIGSLVLFIACTQILEDESLSMNTYEGDDGCVYCHTNKVRLQALAVGGEGHGGNDGG